MVWVFNTWRHRFGGDPALRLYEAHTSQPADTPAANHSTFSFSPPRPNGGRAAIMSRPSHPPPVIDATRETISLDLRTYGEDELAQQVLSIDEETRTKIGMKAWDYFSESRLLAYVLTRAAIAVLEGKEREPKWKRRKLKGIYPGM